MVPVPKQALTQAMNDRGVYAANGAGAKIDADPIGLLMVEGSLKSFARGHGGSLESLFLLNFDVWGQHCLVAAGGSGLGKDFGCWPAATKQWHTQKL
jgi:hypothetical protein